MCKEVKEIKELPNSLVLQANVQSEFQLANWRKSTESESFVPTIIRIQYFIFLTLSPCRLQEASAPLITREKSTGMEDFGSAFEKELIFQDISTTNITAQESNSQFVLSSKNVDNVVEVDSSVQVDATYHLTAVLTHIVDAVDENDFHPSPEHLTVHCLVPGNYLTKCSTPDIKEQSFRVGSGRWHLFNDFSVVESSVEEATNFSLLFKQPCFLFYSRLDLHKRLEIPPSITPVAQLVWADKSLTKRVHNQQNSQAFASIRSLTRGSVVALDAEFVCAEKEETIVKDDGKIVVVKPARLVLARVSVIRGGSNGFVLFLFNLLFEVMLSLLMITLCKNQSALSIISQNFLEFCLV